MSIYVESPDCQAVARLYELSRCGQTENDEFTRLTDEVYGSMFESYAAHEGAGGGDSGESDS
jgi:hypothetical protein